MMERAFSGFAALPDRSKETWRDVLDCHGVRDFSEVKRNYRRLAKEHHPDAGGNPDEFHKIQNAYDEAKSELAS